MRFKSNIWVFISHSNKDYNNVCKVRNIMEYYGLRPLLFYLKCINDEDELEDLIKREINVRERFVLCDSPNARASKWVQSEVNYIKSQTNKVIEQINIYDSPSTLEKQVKHLLFRSTIFLSYQSSDFTLAKELAKKLRQYEYLVFAGEEDVNNNLKVRH